MQTLKKSSKLLTSNSTPRHAIISHAFLNNLSTLTCQTCHLSFFFRKSNILFFLLQSYFLPSIIIALCTNTKFGNLLQVIVFHSIILGSSNRSSLAYPPPPSLPFSLLSEQKLNLKGPRRHTPIRFTHFSTRPFFFFFFFSNPPYSS